MTKTKKTNPLPKPVIALDYDGTITTNIPFWVSFIQNASTAGYEVVIVTMRYAHEKATMDAQVLAACSRLITTGRAAKQDFCAELGIHPMIWIDDNPAWIFINAGDYQKSSPEDVTNAKPF